MASTSAWTGATDTATEGGWSWSDGTPFTYINWNAGDQYFISYLNNVVIVVIYYVCIRKYCTILVGIKQQMCKSEF